jgi:hypothetical protein
MWATQKRHFFVALLFAAGFARCEAEKRRWKTQAFGDALISRSFYELLSWWYRATVDSPPRNIRQYIFRSCLPA